MKLKNIFILLLLSVILFAGCASSSPKQEVVDPNFIGDIDPIQLDDIMCIRKSFGKLKPTELETHFIPRTNTIEVYFRDGMNKYCLIFENDGRESFFEGMLLYANDIEKSRENPKNAMPERDATRKNFYTEGTMSVSWGALGLANNNTTTFQTNYEYLEPNKPYFELMVETTKDSKDSNINSPVVRLYFSPTHLETMNESMSQDALQALVDAKIEEAFAF